MNRFSQILQHLQHLLLVGVFTMLFFSCDPNRVFDQAVSIPNQEWNQAEILKFVVTVDDSLCANNLYITLRNSADYPFCNIYFFMNTRFPDGSLSRDTLECYIADTQGKWLGKSSGSLWTSKILFKKSFRFPRKGTYVLELEQAMRVVNLKGLSEVGLRIEKVK